MTKTKDMFGFQLSDDSHVWAWTDGELTFFSVRFVTLCMPNELFDEMLKGLAQYHRDNTNGTEVV